MYQDRRIAVWCPDWPVTTGRIEAGLRADAPIAVVTANRVVACSHAAREQGVRRGLRRREAQARCPELVVLPRDEAAEARVFEPVVAALESIAPGVEITRPGLAAIGVRGPTRYFGGETGVLHALSRGVAGSPALGGADLLIGIADGAFAAEQAARRGVIVDPGESPAVPRRPADRDARPVRHLAADRPAAPARDPHPRRVRRAAAARRAGPLRPGRRLGAPAGRRPRRPAGVRAAPAGRVHRHPRSRTAGRPRRHRRVLGPRGGRAVRRRPRRRTGWPAPASNCRR